MGQACTPVKLFEAEALTLAVRVEEVLNVEDQDPEPLWVRVPERVNVDERETDKL